MSKVDPDRDFFRKIGSGQTGTPKGPGDPQKTAEKKPSDFSKGKGPRKPLKAPPAPAFAPNSLRAKRLEEALRGDDGGWIKNTDFHWTRTLNGHVLQYWPTKSKYQYRGKARHGDINEFIRRNQK